MRLNLQSVVLVSIIPLMLTANFIWIELRKPKIAYVYNSRLFDEYDGTADSKQLYREKLDVWKNNIKQLAAEVDREISTNNNSPENGIILRKQQDLINYQEAIMKKAEEEDLKLTNSVLNQINTMVEDFGEHHDYDFIFGVTDEGNLLFASDGDDVTDQLLEYMNATYKGI